MNLYLICTIYLIEFIGVVQSYTFTTISANVNVGTGAKPLVLDDGQTYAYTADFDGTIYKVDISTGIKTTLISNGANNCYAIGLYSIGAVATAYSDLLFGGYKEMYNYNSLSVAGTKVKQFAISGYSGLITIPGTIFWPKCMETDTINKVMYISDSNAPSVSASNGVIWKLDFSTAFTSNSLTQLALTLTLGGSTYTPGSPYGMKLMGTILYFVEESANRVCKVDVDPTSSTYLVVTQIITSGIVRPFGIAVDASSSFAYVSTWTTPTNAIIKVDLATSTFTNIVNTPAAVSAMVFNTAGTHIFMMSENNLVKMDLVATAPSPPGPSPSTPVASTPVASTPAAADKSNKSNNLLFLLILLLLIPIICCCCYLVFFGGKRRKNRKEDREEVPQKEDEVDKHKVAETELSPPLHYVLHDGKESIVSPGTITHHYASV